MRDWTGFKAWIELKRPPWIANHWIFGGALVSDLAYLFVVFGLGVTTWWTLLIGLPFLFWVGATWLGFLFLNWRDVRLYKSVGSMTLVAFVAALLVIFIGKVIL